MERSTRAETMLAVFAIAIAIAMQPAIAAAHETPGASRTTTVRASTSYEHGAIWRVFLGDGWREVWPVEITVPVLDLGRYAGGLQPFKAGGNQTMTLRFHGGDGRDYMFRSIDKRIPKQIPNLPGKSIAGDAPAAFHPTGALIVAELQDALGLLQAVPGLVLIPDDPRLGEYRDEYAHVLGTIALRPDEYDNGTVFAGAEKIRDTESLLERLEESSAHRIDSREYLAARLLDFLIGDSDRGGDQWFWAEFEREGVHIHRPIPRDRDFAFVKFGGVLLEMARALDPRLVRFEGEFPPLEALCHASLEFDRSHLVDLGWQEWEAIVHTIQHRLGADVLERAVRRLPKGHYQKSGAEILRKLEARRDALPAMARAFYLMVNREADIFASDDPERVDVERHRDGSVTVRVWRNADHANGGITTASMAVSTPAPVFERHFLPDETREIRIYLERGNDHATVRGTAAGTILVRVAGGEGNDVLEDRSRAATGTVTRFYDASGTNTFVRGEGTAVDTSPFETRPPRRDDDDRDDEEVARVVHEERRGRPRSMMPGGQYVLDPHPPERYWGNTSGWVLTTGYREGGGVVLGIGRSRTAFGFRHQPFKWDADVVGLVGTQSGELGAELDARRHFESSRWSLALFARASNLEVNRFYGYGNDTPLLDPDLTLIERFEVLVRPSLRVSFGAKSALDFGPVVRYVDPQLPAASPVTAARPPGSEPFGQAGLRADLSLDHTDVDQDEQRGVGLELGGSVYPAMWDAEDDFGETHVVARAFIPAGWPTLALRAGAQHCSGAFPLHESAFIGGRWTVRGFRWNRFAGDTSAYATAELRVPVASVVHGRLGLLGFTDTGRVWMDGESPDGWHTGGGAGVWYAKTNRQASVAWAKGDEHRIYCWWGMPF